MSSNPCSDVYDGPYAFSEIESSSMSAYFEALPQQPDVAVCFHSAANLWLYPFGYDYNQYPDNVDELVSDNRSKIAPRAVVFPFLLMALV